MREYIVRETAYPLATKQEIIGELVRCGGCKRWNDDGDGYGLCSLIKYGTQGEWYCAEGERSDDED